MNARASVCHAVGFAILWVGMFSQAVADPPDLLREYRFIPAKSIVHESSGSTATGVNLTVAGTFGLVTGYNDGPTPIASASPVLEPFAAFVNVHGILYPAPSVPPVAVPTWALDLDKTLNLSGLHGTFTVGNPNDISFLGADGQGVALRLQATISGGFLHLTGGSSDPPSTKSTLYQVDALAHLAPFPDFNQDGSITAADIPPMLAALAQLNLSPTAADFASTDLLSIGDVNGDGVFNNADVQALLTMLKTSSVTPTAVPEPSAICLLAIGVCFAPLTIARKIARKV